MSDLTKLTAISPIDGRYRNTTEKLADYFSESALIKYRVLVEIEYFIALCELPLPQLKSFDKSLYPALRNIYKNISEADAQQIKDIEKITNHDVKAVEYFIKEKFDALKINEQKEFIHFGLTSQDINNTAIPYSIKDAMNECLFPLLEDVVNKLSAYSNEWKDVSMLARTHGQPA
ncbi:MAG: lyase family protein, partial [Bacteroidia bacterium]